MAFALFNSCPILPVKSKRAITSPLGGAPQIEPTFVSPTLSPAANVASKYAGINDDSQSGSSTDFLVLIIDS